VLILADNKLTDISALSQLKELRYVELFMNRIPDMSPLVGLPNLTDINIANTHLTDIEPLKQFTQAERLWFAMNGLTSEQNRAVVEALPNCTCNYTTRDETGEGWREGERYQWIRELFQYGK
jgi:Leucine-rich repeat (LRR) protein